jgi:hypothetical protein
MSAVEELILEAIVDRSEEDRSQRREMKHD